MKLAEIQGEDELAEGALHNGERAASPDYFLLLIVASFLIIGLVMVYSSTYAMAYDSYGWANYFIFRQFVWTTLGAIALVVMMRIEYHQWQRFSIPIMAGALLLLGAVLVFARERFGAQRFFLNGSVQPSEFCKLAVIIYIAAWLSSRGKRIRRVTYGLIPFSVLIGLVTGMIILQPDFSTSVLIAAVAVAMFFIAGADLLQLFISFIIGGATLVLLITRTPYRLRRILDFLTALNDLSSTGYHVKHSIIALGTGGITGQGLGASQQKLGYLPAPHTDSIFAVMGEELGLIGCLLVIMLFAALAYRGFKIALEAPDTFGTTLASGITCWLIFQAIINVAVATSTLPFTGIPLPFVSFGGSSMITSLAGIGLLGNISKGAKKAALRRNARYDLRRGDRGAYLPNARRR